MKNLAYLSKTEFQFLIGTEFRVAESQKKPLAHPFFAKNKMGRKYRFTFFNGGRKQVEEVPLGDAKDNIIDLVHYLREVCSYNVYIQF